jgi:hypothetical protein
LKYLIGVDKGRYSFNTETKEIAIFDVPVFALEQVLLITNVTKNRVIYNFAEAGHGAILIGNILTIDVSTSNMEGDVLQIWMEFPEESASHNNFEVLNQILAELKNISFYLHEMPFVLNNGKQFIEE